MAFPFTKVSTIEVAGVVVVDVAGDVVVVVVDVVVAVVVTGVVVVVSIVVVSVEVIAVVVEAVVLIHDAAISERAIRPANNAVNQPFFLGDQFFIFSPF